MRRSLLIAPAVAALAAAAAGCSDSSSPTEFGSAVLAQSALQGDPVLTPQSSGTTARFMAVSPVNQNVVWLAGSAGTFAVTTDGGDTWRSGVVPGAEALQFRDVEGVSATEAYLLSIGVGSDSRIYKTEDAGATWTLQFQATDPNAFYDCFAFWNAKRALVMGDFLEGRLPVLRTTDGETWVDIGANLPPAQAGEAAFASSGTCVATQGGQRAWIITGGAEQSRVLATTDGGDTWNSYATPIVQGTPASGGFSIDFRTPKHGIVGGGDLERGTEVLPNVAVTSDGGQTWQLASPTPFGAIYGLSYVSNAGLTGVVATGPGGAAWSPDEGQTWNPIPGAADYWAVGFATPRAGWLVGTEGRILKLSFQPGDD
jgi:photosystem II stability/assembly factor-like uncharacterized protein